MFRLTVLLLCLLVSKVMRLKEAKMEDFFYVCLLTSGGGEAVGLAVEPANVGVDGGGRSRREVSTNLCCALQRVGSK